MTKLETFDLKAAPFKTRYENFIGGQWVAPKSGQYMPNISPVTGQVICEVARSNAADVEAARDTAASPSAPTATSCATPRAALSGARTG